MAIGSFILALLRALPDLLFLWRRRAENQDREALHEDVQEFRAALCTPSNSKDRAGRLDLAAELLERRVREARDLRQRQSRID